MVRWFKSLFKPRSHLGLISFNQKELSESVQKNWKLLYDLRGEESWKVLMGQLEIFMNQEILNISRIEPNDKCVTRLAVHKGVVDFVSSLSIAIDREFGRLRKETDKTSKEPSYSEKVLGKPHKRRIRPSLS